MVITQIISVPNGTRSRYTEHLASIASTTGRIASYNATMTLILLGFCNFMTPQKPFKGQVPCTPIAEENLFISHYTLNKATQNGHNSDYKCTPSNPKWS